MRLMRSTFGAQLLSGSAMAIKLLFVQGGGEGAHDDWDDKLVRSLRTELGDDYEIRYPRMPDEADPRYAAWTAELRKEFARLGDGALLVGHSIGATILIAMLAEGPPEQLPGGIFLIAAPFIGKGGWPSNDIQPMTRLGARLPQGTPIHLYHGDKDEIAPIDHAAMYQKAIPQAVVHRLASRDHQLNEDLAEVAADIRKLGSGR